MRYAAIVLCLLGVAAGVAGAGQVTVGQHGFILNLPFCGT